MGRKSWVRYQGANGHSVEEVLPSHDLLVDRLPTGAAGPINTLARKDKVINSHRAVVARLKRYR